MSRALLSMTEAQLQASVVEWLQLRRFTVWEGLKGVAFKKGEGRRRGVFLTPGVPDLTAFKALPDGQTLLLYVELKVPGGTLSPDQHARHVELRRAGLPVYIAWSLEGVMAIVARHETGRGLELESGEGWMRAGGPEAWTSWGTRSRT